jgi:hypothetical protein
MLIKRAVHADPEVSRAGERGGTANRVDRERLSLVASYRILPRVARSRDDNYVGGREVMHAGTFTADGTTSVSTTGSQSFPVDSKDNIHWETDFAVRMRSRSVLLGALSATTALLAGACSSSPPDAPLGTGGAPGLQCAYGIKGHTDTIGFPLENDGTASVTLTGIMLPSRHGLKMTRAWVVPIQDERGEHQAIGALTVWPPTAFPVWEHRHAVPGAVVPAGQTLNLVLGLTMTTNRVGHSGGPVIAYTADGNRYTLQEQTGLRMGGDAPCVMPGSG